MSGEEARAIRARLKLSQKGIADLLGVHRVTVAKWETGGCAIDKRTALAIEHLLCEKREEPA